MQTIQGRYETLITKNEEGSLVIRQSCYPDPDMVILIPEDSVELFILALQDELKGE